MYCQLITIHHEDKSTRSPVVFAHGFPDSPQMFEAYYQSEEQTQDWLKHRSIYAIAFPNRHTNPNFPSLRELVTVKMRREFEIIMQELIEKSPTKQIVPIVHDLGATYTWRFIRQHEGQGIEKIVSLSVASSFRYDIWEHGLFAFAWLYSLIYILPYYLPSQGLRNFLADTLENTAGYQSSTVSDVYKDVFHYWYAPLWMIRFPIFLIPLPSYTQFSFPVLYIRSKLDRIASTSAFERVLGERDDCEIHIWDDTNHWFPEQQSDRVLTLIRSFLKK